MDRRHHLLTPTEEKRCLLWLSEQGMMRLDHVYALLAIHSISTARASVIVRRWLRMKWVRVVIRRVHEPVWCCLTDLGSTYLHCTRTQLCSTDEEMFNEEMLSHLYTVNAIRLVVAAELPAACWTQRHQRELRNSSPTRSEDTDAEVRLADGTLIGVYVIVTACPSHKVQASLLRECECEGRTTDAQYYKKFWYFAPLEVAVSIAEQRWELLVEERLTLQQAQAISVYALEKRSMKELPVRLSKGW